MASPRQKSVFIHFFTVAALLVPSSSCRQVSSAAEKVERNAHAATPVAEPTTQGFTNEGPARGVVISCPRNGQIWGTDDMSTALRGIKALGANWAQIHPYAWVGRDGDVRWRPAKEEPYLRSASVRTTKEQMRLFWKPHLGYWGQFSWRGAITFQTPEEWKRFFDGYEGFIVDQATLANEMQVPWFSVGTELDATAQRPEWKRIIKAVRKVYQGKLTYAANWDSLEKIPFWADLDFIALQAYFPIAEAAPAASWKELAVSLEKTSKRYGKKILFAEVGYARSLTAAAKPWEPGTDDSPAAKKLRRTLMETALAAVSDQEWFAGMFWWKWIPGSHYFQSDFAIQDEEASAALRAAWRTNPRAKGKSQK